MATVLAEHWKERFNAIVRREEHSGPLASAALNERLGEWTAALTRVVVATCQACGWTAAAKGHRLDLLPVARSEYLGLDVVAFADGQKRWRFLTAAVELENSGDADRIAYSLWKVLCVKADLRVVFCYRQRAEDAMPLVRFLRDEVVHAMEISSRMKLEGETVVVVGSRGEVDTFPYGFFRWWRLDAGTATFDGM